VAKWQRGNKVVTSVSLITITDGKNTYAVIQNCSPYAIWIERNDPMGYAENHTEEEKSE
jgi:hypothetical protein